VYTFDILLYVWRVGVRYALGAEASMRRSCEYYLLGAPDVCRHSRWRSTDMFYVVSYYYLFFCNSSWCSRGSYLEASVDRPYITCRQHPKTSPKLQYAPFFRVATPLHKRLNLAVALLGCLLCTNLQHISSALPVRAYTQLWSSRAKRHFFDIRHKLTAARAGWWARRLWCCD